MRPEHWLFAIPLRLRSLFRGRKRTRNWTTNCATTSNERPSGYVAQGMMQEEAHRRARLDLGGIEQTKEKCRDARRVNWIQDFVQDLRFSLARVAQIGRFQRCRHYHASPSASAPTPRFSAS